MNAKNFKQVILDIGNQLSEFRYGRAHKEIPKNLWELSDVFADRAEVTCPNPPTMNATMMATPDAGPVATREYDPREAALLAVRRISEAYDHDHHAAQEVLKFLGKENFALHTSTEGRTGMTLLKLIVRSPDDRVLMFPCNGGLNESDKEIVRNVMSGLQVGEMMEPGTYTIPRSDKEYWGLRGHLYPDAGCGWDEPTGRPDPMGAVA